MAGSKFPPFTNSAPYQDHEERISAIELNNGSGTPDNWYSTVAAIRALTGYDEGDDIGLLPTTIYTYDSTNAEDDDGDKYLQPSDNSGAGRWVRQVSFALQSHNHTDKLDKPTGENLKAGYLYTVNSSGDLVPLNVTVENFVKAAEGYGLSQENFSTELKEKLEDIPEDLDITGKVDKITATTGNAGNIPILDNGNTDRGIIDSGLKPADLIDRIAANEEDEETGETLLEQDGTATFTLPANTGYDIAIMYLGLKVGDNSTLPVTIEVDSLTGSINAKNDYDDNIEFTAECALNGTIPTVTITITTTTAQVKVTKSKIIYL